MLISTSFILMLLGKMLRDSNVENVNKFIGYRTKNSMKSKENWIKAQNLSANLMQRIFFIITFMFIPFTIIDILSLFNFFSDNVFVGSLIIQVVIILLGFLSIFLVTERKLTTKE